MTEPFTLADVRDDLEPDVYPNDVLQGCETALALFTARWYGRQDCYWLAQAGLTATCVDTDQVRLQEMKRIYPPGWELVAADCFEFAQDAASQGLRWDVVSLDEWTQDFDRCAAMADLWCELARRVVILGSGISTSVTAPEGWRITEVLKRSDYDGGVFWHVLEPV